MVACGFRPATLHAVVKDLNMYARTCPCSVSRYQGLPIRASHRIAHKRQHSNPTQVARVHNPPPLAPKCPFLPCHPSHALHLPLYLPTYPPTTDLVTPRAWLALAQRLPAPSSSSYSRHTTRCAQQEPSIPLTPALPSTIVLIRSSSRSLAGSRAPTIQQSLSRELRSASRLPAFPPPDSGLPALSRTGTTPPSHSCLFPDPLL